MSPVIQNPHGKKRRSKKKARRKLKVWDPSDEGSYDRGVEVEDFNNCQSLWLSQNRRGLGRDDYRRRLSSQTVATRYYGKYNTWTEPVTQKEAALIRRMAKRYVTETPWAFIKRLTDEFRENLVDKLPEFLPSYATQASLDPFTISPVRDVTSWNTRQGFSCDKSGEISLVEYVYAEFQLVLHYGKVRCKTHVDVRWENGNFKKMWKVDAETLLEFIIPRIRIPKGAGFISSGTI